MPRPCLAASKGNSAVASLYVGVRNETNCSGVKKPTRCIFVQAKMRQFHLGTLYCLPVVVVTDARVICHRNSLRPHGWMLAGVPE